MTPISKRENHCPMSKSKRLINPRDLCAPPKIKHLALVMLVHGALMGSSIANQEHSFSSILPQRVEEKKTLIQKLESEKLHWQKLAEQSAHHTGSRLDLDELKKELGNLSQEIKELQRTNQKTATINAYFRDQITEHRTNIRAKAKGEKIAFLPRANREPFKDVIILRVHDGGMKIRHSIGAANIAFENLPQGLQERFRFDPNEAAAHREKEAFEQQKLDIRLEKMEAEQKSKVAPKAKAQPEFKQQPIPMPVIQQKVIKGSISVRVIKTDRQRRLPKCIQINAKAGTESMSVSGPGFRETIPAGQIKTLQYWVPEKYCVSAYQDGELVDQESWKSKTGL